MKTLRIDIWSDIACPWCYVGKRRLEKALAQFPHRDQVRVTWHSFELDPKAGPAKDATDYAQRLANKYGRTLEQAQSMLASMTQTAAAEGLDFHFEIIRAGNTFDAHRVLHLAQAHGKGNEAKERFMRAYFCEGAAMSDHGTLVKLAADVGLPEEEVRANLASAANEAEVREDEAAAHALGIHGVPFFVFDGRLGVSGAQPPELLLKVLGDAWAALPDEVAPVSGEVCGPDGCA